MNTAQLISDLNISARKVHGKDICILLARAVSFGNDDNLIVVLGKNHTNVAADVARCIGKAATISVEPHTGFHGEPKGFKSLVCF